MVSNWWNSEIQFFRYILPLNVITGLIYGIFKAILLAIIARSIYYEKRHHNKKKFKIWIHFTSLNSIHSFLRIKFYSKIDLKMLFYYIIKICMHSVAGKHCAWYFSIACILHILIISSGKMNYLFPGEWPWISNIWCSIQLKW